MQKIRSRKKTRAIAPVHLFGNACDIDKVNKLAKEHNLKIIFDAAQAHLTKYKGADVGSFGDAVCYSFYATKNMTTGGEGGMIVSNNDELIKQCILLKRQGQQKKYYHTITGTNYRMTDMQAAVGLAQLKKLPEFTRKRQKNAGQLDAELKVLPQIITPYVAPETTHSYHQYTIQLPPEVNRDKFVQALKDRQIGSSINYPTPLHQQPALKQYSPGNIIEAEQFSTRCVSLPVHPKVGPDDIKKVAYEIKKLIM